MIYVVNDMHGNKRLVDGVVSQMQGLHPDDTLIINGDGAGARGPIMNNLVKIFYEVRRKETPKASATVRHTGHHRRKAKNPRFLS